MAKLSSQIQPKQPTRADVPTRSEQESLGKVSKLNRERHSANICIREESERSQSRHFHHRVSSWQLQKANERSRETGFASVADTPRVVLHDSPAGIDNHSALILEIEENQERGREGG